MVTLRLQILECAKKIFEEIKQPKLFAELLIILLQRCVYIAIFVEQKAKPPVLRFGMSLKYKIETPNVLLDNTLPAI